jgi:sporulation protein YlmC with PRC-barrel domain
MRDRDFVGKVVVSMADGAQVGRVKDLVFNDLNLSALVVQGDRGEGLLPFPSLESNGPDVITIASYSVLDWNPGDALEPSPRTIHDLRKLTVVDSDGNVLGHIHDFTMDAVGHVQEIDIRTEGVFGLGAHKTVIDGAQVCALGADLMTVKIAPSNSGLAAAPASKAIGRLRNGQRSHQRED